MDRSTEGGFLPSCERQITFTNTNNICENKRNIGILSFVNSLHGDVIVVKSWRPSIGLYFTLFQQQ